MIRFYILPIERIDDAGTIRRGPAYFNFRGHIEAGHIQLDNAAGEGWCMKDYGSIDMAVFALNAATAKHTDLASRLNVYAFPENLDQTMTQAQRGALNTYLEAHAIPGDWLKNGDTFRSTLRIITAMMLFLQRALAILGYPTDPLAGLTLNTRYGQLTAAYQQALSQAATDLGYTWGVVANDQIRKIWKLMADQWGSRIIGFGFIDL
jgi:hypothetical protein